MLYNINPKKPYIFKIKGAPLTHFLEVFFFTWQKKKKKKKEKKELHP